MDRVSRPLLGVLVATVLLAVLWVMALKPSNSSTSANGTGGGVGQYQSAINAAHNVQNVVNRGTAASAGTTPSASATPSSSSKSPVTVTATPSKAAATSTPAANAAPAKTAPAKTAPAKTAAAKTAPTKAATSSTASTTQATVSPTVTKAPSAPATPAARELAVVTALRANKVLALLFYNPGAPDDKAVAKELRSIPTAHGKVYSLAIPISELYNYSAVTNQVAVTTAPTLVFIDRSHYATTIVGYASQFEIAQRVADALAAK